ncbi:unnamed protein product [Rotaria magnacalcarata]
MSPTTNMPSHIFNFFTSRKSIGSFESSRSDAELNSTQPGYNEFHRQTNDWKSIGSFESSRSDAELNSTQPGYNEFHRQTNDW